MPIGVAIPLAGVGLTYLLWWISDRLVVIGPIDRATFGWLVVVPIWALTPTMAAYAWRRFEPEDTWLIAAVVGLVIATLAALLFWLAVAFPDCEFGAVRTSAQSILPSTILGVVIGADFAGTCLGSTALLRSGRRWSSLLVGAGSAFALIFVAILVAGLSLGIGTGICQRPLS